MKLWDLAVRRPVTLLMALISLLVLGLVSLSQLKLAFLPQVDFPAMWVVASAPDQNPQILEREVTRVLEEGLGSLRGITRISSETSADSAQIRLDFAWGMELDLIRLELGLRIEELKPQLPDFVRQVQIYSFNTADMPVVEGRISAEGIDLSENYDLLEERIKRPIEALPGVARVELGGVLPREVSIELRLDRILEHQVDVGPVIERLSRDNIALAGGQVRETGLVYNLRSLGRIQSLEEFASLPINDQGLRLSDIADIRYEEPPIDIRRHLDGHKALALLVYKESSANTVEVARSVNRLIRQDIDADPVLQGISLIVWGDQAKEITSGLRGLSESGVLGALFAVVILYLFLRQFRATLIIACSIPVSIIGTFIFFRFFGFTLNILTLMGLMLAVGMLVDNAVVVLESIFQKKLQGLSAVEATKEGTREVLTALIASTTTTMVVFLSLVVSEKNELSVWLSSIGLTICFTLGVSLLVSITIIPLFTSRLLRGRFTERKTGAGRLMTLYSRLLDTSIAHPRWTSAGMLVILLLSFVPFPMLGRFKGTGVKTDRLMIRYQVHDFFFLGEMEAAVNQVEAWLETQRQDLGLASIYSYMMENEAGTILTFADADMSQETFRAIRKSLREGLPQLGGISFILDDDRQESGNQVRLQLFAADAESIAAVQPQIIQALQGIEGLFDLRRGGSSPGKELQVHILRDEAAAYGVTPEQIAQVFGFTLGGTYLPRFVAGDREREVSLGLRLQDRATMEDVARIPIARDIPLAAVARFSFEEQPGRLERVDRKTFGSILGSYEGENLKSVMTEIEGRLAHFSFPAGVSWSWSERILEEENKMQGLLLNLALALFLVYLVLACLFESFVQPLLIFCTIFFSLFGVSWLLLLTGTEFGIMAGIGMLILLGIVVNNGIMMMDHINHLRRTGLELTEAVRLGAKERIRPILMTAATTVIGMLPMALGQSAIGDGYYFPLARTVIGGLTSSTLLTLVGLPWIILSHDRLSRWTRRLWNRLLPRRRRQSPQPAPA